MSDDKVLLSDFDLWHYVLNYWYLPHSERDDNDFNGHIESFCWSWSDPPQDKCINDKIRSSWERIFNLDWSDEYLTAPKANKSIQATLWQLNLAQVTTVDRFVAR